MHNEDLIFIESEILVDIATGCHYNSFYYKLFTRILTGRVHCTMYNTFQNVNCRYCSMQKIIQNVEIILMVYNQADWWI